MSASAPGPADSPLPLEQAQARLLALAPALAVERVAAERALGRYLAEPLRAARSQPAADLSAMDGFAVAAGDRTGPWTVIGESAAGHPWAGTIAPGQALRISTGAPLPAGADTVIVQEDLALDGDRLVLTGTGPDRPGAHVRPRASDFAHGDLLLPAGAPITPATVALALAAGCADLPVHHPPRIAVIDSGDELAADPAQCAPHQVPASNGAMLAAMLTGLASTVTRIGPVPDHAAALRRALDQAGPVDLIVTSGGASVGDHDLVRPALVEWGATIDFWRVAIKPGKPLLVARRGRQLVLGLPGNPVSSYVTAFLFLLPLVRTMLGASHPLPRPFTAKLAAELRPGGPRREFLRAYWDGERIWPTQVQDSSGLTALAQANALIDRPAAARAASENSPVTIYLLQNGGVA